MESTVQPVTRLFTFGYGQTCQFTGDNLADRYALVTARDASSARLLMVAAFGRNWAFEYDPTSPQIADYMPQMTLHAHLVLGVDIDVSDPDPTGLTYGRGDDGETTQPVGRVEMHTGGMVDGDHLVDETKPASCVPECGGGRQCRCQGGWS